MANFLSLYSVLKPFDETINRPTLIITVVTIIKLNIITITIVNINTTTNKTIPHLITQFINNLLHLKVYNNQHQHLRHFRFPYLLHIVINHLWIWLDG